MKTLEQIKNDYAIKRGFDSWYDLYSSCVFKINEFEKHTDKVCKIAQIECLKLASLNIDYKYTFLYNSVKNVGDEVAKQITNENNIIK